MLLEDPENSTLGSNTTSLFLSSYTFSFFFLSFSYPKDLGPTYHLRCQTPIPFDPPPHKKPNLHNIMTASIIILSNGISSTRKRTIVMSSSKDSRRVGIAQEGKWTRVGHVTEGLQLLKLQRRPNRKERKHALVD